MPKNSSRRPPAASLLYRASLLGAAALVGCGGGSSGPSPEPMAANVDATTNVADLTASNSTTAVRLASITANNTPILTCDAAGIGNVKLVSDLPTLPSTTPPNDSSASITSVSTGTASGVPYCLVKVLVPPAINLWACLPTGVTWIVRLKSEGGGC